MSGPLKLRSAFILVCAALALAACGGARGSGVSFASPSVSGGGGLQCVPYARQESGILLRGDAHTWWEQANGRYARAWKPRPGSVMVLKGYQRSDRGHVAVVRRVVNDREIVVDHANWLNDGRVYRDQPVKDVSAGNDWSLVRVWYAPGRQYGARAYEVQGFILPETRYAGHSTYDF